MSICNCVITVESYNCYICVFEIIYIINQILTTAYIDDLNHNLIIFFFID